MPSFRQLLALCALLLQPWLYSAASAQSGTETFGEYQVHYSVFSSTFVQPDIASLYNINRARDRSLVNISVMRTADGNTSLGLPAEVSGTATNLVQQQQTLDFQEISEGDATYYIASVRHIDEEMHNFRIKIQPENAERPLDLKFSRKLYLER